MEVTHVVYYGPKGLIEEIYIKEWDGEKVTMEGIKLNLSRFVMILHNVEIIDHTIDKIQKGEQDLDVKIHIGGSFYLSANIYLFIWGFTSLSTLYRSYHDG